MKRILTALMAMAATAATAVTMLTVPDDTVLYTDADPFAIGLATSAYTQATNAQGRIDALVVSMADTNAVTKQTTLTFNGLPWQMSSNAVLSAATVAQGAKADTALQPAATNGWTVSTHDGLASVASLYTLMATSQVTKVWEGTNAWYTFASNTVTRFNTTVSNAWYVSIVGYLYTDETMLEYIQQPTNFWSDAPHDVWYQPNESTYLGVRVSNNGSETNLYSAFPVAANAFSTTFDQPLDEFNMYQITGYPPYETSPVGVKFLWSQYGITTNSTVYYLPTNLVPAETWSYTDQTNWMADGNAGQVWVTGLASDAAQVIMNGHLAASDPHAGKYVKLTGGASTNQTIVNGNVSGDTLIGAVAVTNAILANQQLIATLYLTGTQVTNVTSELLFKMTNAAGVTTAQVWRTGGVVDTNFFADAVVASASCLTNWVRPNYWPVAAGYSATSWVQPETNVVKWVTRASAAEDIQIATSTGGFFVDWYGDGSAVSNYTSGAVARFGYPDAIRGEYKTPCAFTFGATNITAVTFFASDTSLIPDGKVSECVEVIAPVGPAEPTLSVLASYEIVSIVDHSSGAIPANFLYAAMTMVHYSGPRKTATATSAFLNSNVKFVHLDSCLNFHLNTFLGVIPICLYAPAITNIMTGANLGMDRVWDFPNLLESSASANAYVEQLSLPAIKRAAFAYCFRLKDPGRMPALRIAGTEFFYRCNVGYAAATNFFLGLTSTTPTQFIDFRQNPGTADVKTWYFSGSVSNDLDTLGWRITL